MTMQFVNGAGTRPADHRIALAHLRGLTARQIGEALTLPTEYVERRLPHVVDMPIVVPIVVPPTLPTLANRILALLQDAAGQPVRIEDLLGVYPDDQEGSLGSIKTKITALRERGHAITSRALFEMLREPRLAKTSVVMVGMTNRLRDGMASSDELAVAGAIESKHVHRYVHMLRERGAEIVLHRTYVLTPQENPS